MADLLVKQIHEFLRRNIGNARLRHHNPGRFVGEFGRLWSDLAFRGDQASGGKVDPAWRDAFLEFPERFVIGTDTCTPVRWHYIGTHADYSRGWLADLPEPLAASIGGRNAEALLRGTTTRPA